MERICRMTILIKSLTRNSKKNNIEWIERMESKNINWAMWGGWFDSDGCFSFSNTKFNSKFVVVLALKDRDPVELFAKTFESSLEYMEYWTTPYNKDGIRTPHLSKTFKSRFKGDRALWFANKIKKFILQKTSKIKPFLDKQNINYKFYSEQWTKEEWIYYITSLIEGDGTFYDRNKNTKTIVINSSNEPFLKYISDQLQLHKIMNFGKITKCKGHPKDDGSFSVMYSQSLRGKLPELKIVLNTLLPHMTMERKRQNVLKTLAWIDAKL